MDSIFHVTDVDLDICGVTDESITNDLRNLESCKPLELLKKIIKARKFIMSNSNTTILYRSRCLPFLILLANSPHFDIKPNSSNKDNTVKNSNQKSSIISSLHFQIRIEATFLIMTASFLSASKKEASLPSGSNQLGEKIGTVDQKFAEETLCALSTLLESDEPSIIEQVLDGLYDLFMQYSDQLEEQMEGKSTSTNSTKVPSFLSVLTSAPVLLIRASLILTSPLYSPNSKLKAMIICNMLVSSNDLFINQKTDPPSSHTSSSSTSPIPSFTPPSFFINTFNSAFSLYVSALNSLTKSKNQPLRIHASGILAELNQYSSIDSVSPQSFSQNSIHPPPISPPSPSLPKDLSSCQLISKHSNIITLTGKDIKATGNDTVVFEYEMLKGIFSLEYKLVTKPTCGAGIYFGVVNSSLKSQDLQKKIGDSPYPSYSGFNCFRTASSVANILNGPSSSPNLPSFVANAGDVLCMEVNMNSNPRAVCWSVNGRPVSNHIVGVPEAVCFAVGFHCCTNSISFVSFKEVSTPAILLSSCGSPIQWQ